MRDSARNLANEFWPDDDDRNCNINPDVDTTSNPPFDMKYLINLVVEEFHSYNYNTNWLMQWVLMELPVLLSVDRKAFAKPTFFREKEMLKFAELCVDIHGQKNGFTSTNVEELKTRIETAISESHKKRPKESVSNMFWSKGLSARHSTWRIDARTRDFEILDDMRDYVFRKPIKNQGEILSKLTYSKYKNEIDAGDGTPVAANSSMQRAESSLDISWDEKMPKTPNAKVFIDEAGSICCEWDRPPKMRWMNRREYLHNSLHVSKKTNVMRENDVSDDSFQSCESDGLMRNDVEVSNET